MVLKTSAGAPITCQDWDNLVDEDGFLALGKNRYHCAYIIYSDGTFYYAENGDTGNLDYGGPNNIGVAGNDASAVIEAALAAMNDWDLIYFKKVPINNSVTLDENRRVFSGHVYADNALTTMFITSGWVIDLIFHDFVADGKNKVDAIFKLHGVNHRFVNCDITNLKTDGIGIWFAWDVASWTAHELLVYDSRITGQFSDDGLTYHSYAGGDTSVGILLDEYGYDHEIHDSVIRYVGEACIKIDTSGAHRIYNNHLYGRSQHAIYGIDVEGIIDIQDNYINGKFDEILIYYVASGLFIGKCKVAGNWIGATELSADNTFPLIKFQTDQTLNRLVIKENYYTATAARRATYALELVYAAITNCDIEILTILTNHCVNVSLKTRNEGTAVIANGTNSITQAHGLTGTPTNIRVTGRGHAEVSALYVTNLGAANFDIVKGTAGNVTADRTVFWYAEIQ